MGAVGEEHVAQLASKHVGTQCPAVSVKDESHVVQAPMAVPTTQPKISGKHCNVDGFKVKLDSDNVRELLVLHLAHVVADWTAHSRQLVG